MAKKVKEVVAEEIIVVDATVIEQEVESPVEKEDPGHNTRAFRQ